MSATLVCADCSSTFQAKRSDALRCLACTSLRRKQYLKEYEHGKRRGHCEGCEADIGIRAKWCVPCSNRAKRGISLGSSNPNWKEGRSQGNGYVLIRVKIGAPGKGKGAFYRGEHLIVWEEANGPIPKGWVIHHLNGDKMDNRLENLLALPKHEHHSHPRDALKPYEERIKFLENKLKELS